MSERIKFLTLFVALHLASSAFAESPSAPASLPPLSSIEQYQRPLVVSEVSSVRPSDAVASTSRAEVFPVDMTRDIPAMSGERAASSRIPGGITSDLVDTVRSTEPLGPYADLWDRIRDGFKMQNMDGPRVVRQVEWFELHPDYMYRVVDRSRKYLFFIVEEVQKRGMPSEIALLPIIESAFDPHALSSANASGMWQFIPSTGKNFGLRQNWWYDGRRDIVAATNGALDYLEKLHAQFGAWDLALAAYNCGEGGLARAIERNQRLGLPTDYASLNLPEETRNYVPKLLAAKQIVADPIAHGLSLLPIPDAPYFAAITTTKQVDLAVAARFANLSEADFLALNPGYNRPLILAQGEKTILVPVANAETFRARLNDPDAKLVSWRTHRLKRGENFAAVASQFGMSSDELKKVNGISANRRIAGGGAILVRDAHADEGDLDAAAPLEAETPPPMETITFSHRVKRGESLASIARRYNISIGSLRTWNRISPTQGAHVGQLLVMHRSAEMGEPSLKEGLSEASIISSSSPINSVPASSATHSAPAKPAVKAPPTTRVKQLAPSKKPVVAAKTVKASPSPQTKKSNN